MREPMPATRHLKVFETIGEAWGLTKGSKWAIWAPMLVLFALVFVFSIVFAGLGALFKTPATADTAAHLSGIGILLMLITSIILAYLSIGLFAGVIRIVIDRARGNAVSGTSGFHSFSRTIPLFFTFLLTIIIVEVPLIIAFVVFMKIANISQLNQLNPSAFILTQVTIYIYGFIFGSLFYLTSLFAVDQTNNPFAAVARSVKTVVPHWLRIIGIMLITYAIMLVFYIPFLLGAYFHNTPLILVGLAFFILVCVWLLPFMILIPAIVYHKLVD